MKSALILFALAFSTAIRAQTTWSIDNAHTNVTFSITHMTISQVDGRFKMYSGKATSKSETDFSGAQVEFSIDVSSIDTDNDKRDSHLKSDDFFNAEKYPKITFKSTSMKKTGDKQYVLEGDLTIRDVTKKVKLDVVYNGTMKDPYGNTKAGFVVTGAINRFDYGLKWNSMADSAPVVGKEVKMVINIQLKKDA